MSECAYKGTLKLNKPLTKEVYAEVHDIFFNDEDFELGEYWKDAFMKPIETAAENGSDEIEFKEVYNDSMDEHLRRVGGILTDNGYTMVGTLDRYDGVPTEGKLFVTERGEIVEYDIQDCWIEEAPTKKLIEVLESRGVHVPPYNVAVSVLKTPNKGDR